MTRWIGLGFLAVVLISAWIYLVWPTPARLRQQEKQEQRQETPIQIQGVELYDSKSDGLRLKAKTAKVYLEQGQIYFTDLIGKKADTKGKVSFKLEAKTAKMSKTTGLVTVQGGVKVSLPSGQTLITEELVYNKQKGLVIGKKEVIAEGIADRLHGTGMRYNIAKETLEIFHPQIILHGL